ncbi:hypothetical protein OsccyDRAFT_4636 [Leptolyngbyaceae cyanobacterium JSC-12]|nr:hypothetical protein OsccyDRAFT_4636 [Leptolyngbyaceae cyanobacterium JSC-12]
MQDKTREFVTEQRQHTDQLEEKVHTRAVDDIKTSADTDPADTEIQEETRELVVEKRLHEEHLQETTHKRAVDEITKSAAP